ncbi:MAG: histone deacetylase [Deltaproteobacteria bacterium]|nr:histone deacetylase [Deltaproteobacteria bacterium]
MNKTGLIISGYHHDTGVHPERAERLRAVEEVCRSDDIAPRLLRLEPRAATVGELARVHDRDYILQVEEACKGGIHALDADTMISSASYEEACRAAGSGLTLLDAMMAGLVRNGFCAVRPPGHHAEHDRAMGFCLFNNVAVTARYAQERHGLKNILIVDWDVHHGNGTQNSFYADPSVFYFSIHQYPHYPGSGADDQRGKGEGEGRTLNVPLPAGGDDKVYRESLVNNLMPEIEGFAPDLILVSAGFDAHMDDPLAGMNVTDEGFGWMTEFLVDLAGEHCGGRLLSLLEGGYSLSGLKGAVRMHLRALVKV